jgi:hypothetical protein
MSASFGGSIVVCQYPMAGKCSCMQHSLAEAAIGRDYKIQPAGSDVRSQLLASLSPLTTDAF